MTRLRALGACALAAGIWLVAAVPAHAGTPNITIRTPAAGQAFITEGFRFDATAEMGSDGRLEGQVTVAFGSGAAGRPVPATVNKDTNNARTVNVTHDVSFPWNGHYQVSLTATGRNNFLDGDRTPATATRAFSIDAAPRVPTGLKAVADGKTRVVTVSWAVNPEPDRVGYVVQKQGTGGRWNDFLVTDKTSVADESTASAGGTYTYRVRALRHSARPNELNQSEPSASQSATVASPPVATPTTTPGGGGDADGGSEGGREGSTGGDTGHAGGTSDGGTAGSSGGATSSGGTNGSRSGPPNLSSTGKVDLSDFQSLLAKSKQGGGPGGGLASGEDEGTYDETLPFGSRRLVDSDGDGEVDDAPGSVVSEGDESGPDFQSLGFLAGGLLATVLAMHVLWVRSEVNRVEKLEVVAPEEPAPVSAEERFGVSESRPRRSRSRPAIDASDPAAAP